MSEKFKYFKKRLKLYHRYYLKTGLYKFVLKNFLKVFLIIAVIIFVLVFIEKYIIDFDDFFEKYIQGLKWYYVIISFFISEAFMGLIPPDFYIIWAYKMPEKYQMLTLLAILSYVGGIYAYYLGRLIRKIPKINNFVHRKYDNHFITIKKWGGLIIVLSALLPIPFSIISMVAGIMHYPVKNYLLFALARIPRFYLYAIIIFNIMK
jgi:membrane protein YqaA with SNARE-associated domain